MSGYLEGFLENVESMPADMRRNLTQLRDLDQQNYRLGWPPRNRNHTTVAQPEILHASSS